MFLFIGVYIDLTVDTTHPVSLVLMDEFFLMVPRALTMYQHTFFCDHACIYFGIE